MTEIGKPFGFFKPALEVEPAFSCSFSTPTRTSLRRATTSFSPFLQLPFELRAQITRISIRNAAGDLYEWSGTGGDPVVLQSRRGILRVQTQQKQPPSLAQLACVSKEWQDEIEKRLFETLSLTIRPSCKPGECSDIVKFASIVTGPRRRYLSGLQLDFCREYQTYQTSDSDFYRTGGGYRCFIRLLRILGTWGREQVADRLLMVELQIELYDSPLLPLMKKIRSLPTIPIIGELVITTDLGKFRNMPLALLYLFRKLPELRSADLYLSRWCSSRETDKNYKLEGGNSVFFHYHFLPFSSLVSSFLYPPLLSPTSSSLPLSQLTVMRHDRRRLITLSTHGTPPFRNTKAQATTAYATIPLP